MMYGCSVWGGYVDWKHVYRNPLERYRLRAYKLFYGLPGNVPYLPLMTELQMMPLLYRVALAVTDLWNSMVWAGDNDVLHIVLNT